MTETAEVLLVRTDVAFAPVPNVAVVLRGRVAAPPAAVPVTSACAIVRDGLGRVLLTWVVGRGYDLPGGHLEPGETPEQACRREIAEETGLEVAPGVPFVLAATIHLEVAAPAPAGYRYPWPRAQMWVFGIRLGEPGGAVAPRPGSDECTHARWVADAGVARLCVGRIWLPAVLGSPGRTGSAI